MAKPNPDEQWEAGERRLSEWGVGRDASAAELSAVLHRDVAADVAIAHRLGAIATDESADVLRRLERDAGDKRVRREAKRARYRLEQRGVHVTEPAPTEPPAPVTAVAIEGYVSPVDGRGDQLVWLVKPQPGGIAHLFAVVNDPEGLRDVALNMVTRKSLKSIRGELERKHDLRLFEVDWHYADYLIHRAFEWARVRDTRMAGDYPALRAQLSRQPPPESMPPSVLGRLDASALEPRDALLAESPGLLEEAEFRTWFLSAEQLRPFLDELASVKESPLVLNRAQQQERFEDVIARAIDSVFAADTHASWARRLYEMGYCLAVTRRAARAAQAVAVARALEAGDSPRQIPFCAQLVRASLGFFFQLALEQEQEREKSALVLTPQQAMARRGQHER
jgi:hypothetical protein